MKTTLLLFAMVAPLTFSQVAFVDTTSSEPPSAKSVGFYCVTTDKIDPLITIDGGPTVRLGKKAEIQILAARIYSQNNANTEFDMRLETSNFPVDPKTSVPTEPVALRIDIHEYLLPNGWAGGNVMFFQIHGQDTANNIAKALSAECSLRSPPGYKIFPQFIPAKSSFPTNGPVSVKFVLKNLDDRTLTFQRGGQQRGSRDNQYGFLAMLIGNPGGPPIQPVTDTGNPVNWGGLCGLVKLEPGKVFDDQIDLKKWFSFDKPGTYQIHGFYQMAFYQEGKELAPWNVIWTDYASADFMVVVK